MLVPKRLVPRQQVPKQLASKQQERQRPKRQERQRSVQVLGQQLELGQEPKQQELCQLACCKRPEQ